MSGRLGSRLASCSGVNWKRPYFSWHSGAGGGPVDVCCRDNPSKLWPDSSHEGLFESESPGDDMHGAEDKQLSGPSSLSSALRLADFDA